MIFRVTLSERQIIMLRRICLGVPALQPDLTGAKLVGARRTLGWLARPTRGRPALVTDDGLALTTAGVYTCISLGFLYPTHLETSP